MKNRLRLPRALGKQQRLLKARPKLQWRKSDPPVCVRLQFSDHNKVLYYSLMVLLR